MAIDAWVLKRLTDEGAKGRLAYGPLQAMYEILMDLRIENWEKGNKQEYTIRHEKVKQQTLFE